MSGRACQRCDDTILPHLRGIQRRRSSNDGRRAGRPATTVGRVMESGQVARPRLGPPQPVDAVTSESSISKERRRAASLGRPGPRCPAGAVVPFGRGRGRATETGAPAGTATSEATRRRSELAGERPHKRPCGGARRLGAADGGEIHDGDLGRMLSGRCPAERGRGRGEGNPIWVRLFFVDGFFAYS